jgi:hypothetical protein
MQNRTEGRSFFKCYPPPIHRSRLHCFVFQRKYSSVAGGLHGLPGNMGVISNLSVSTDCRLRRFGRQPSNKQLPAVLRSTIGGRAPVSARSGVDQDCRWFHTPAHRFYKFTLASVSGQLISAHRLRHHSSGFAPYRLYQLRRAVRKITFIHKPGDSSTLRHLPNNNSLVCRPVPWG